MSRTQEESGIAVRTAGPGDAEVLTALLGLLSPRSAFMRFLAGLGAPKPGLVRALLATGHDRGALLATLPGGSAVGHACWRVSSTGTVDVGIVVLDGWQRRGLGRRLLETAVGQALAAGGERLHLDVHPENRALVAALRDQLPEVRPRLVDGLVSLDVPLPPDVRQRLDGGPGLDVRRLPSVAALDPGHP